MKIFFRTLWKYSVTVGGRRKQANTFTGLCYQSSPTSCVSAGKNGRLYLDDGWVLTPTISHGGRIVSFTVQKLTTTASWKVEFTAILGHKLALGAYPGVTRHPIEYCDKPGLNFSGCGRENSKLTGRFEILEIFVMGGQVLSFAADFLQNDEGHEANWNRGSIRYNSRLHFPIDEKGKDKVGR